jgi:hypothetical protein
MEKNYKKELMLKGNSVKRTLKEYESYVKEVEKLQNKINEMVSNSTDEYDINKHKEYLDESSKVKDSIKEKLRKFTDDLAALVEEITSDEVKELEEYKNATSFLSSALEVFNTSE